MSFLNPHPVPVTLYQSTDPDAPQLANTDWTGAIKTLLKACLVTGYGGKAGQGWAIADETSNKAIFTPQDPAAPVVGLLMDSSNSQYSQMDLLWQGQAQNIPATTAGMRIHRNPSGQSTQWRLVASPRGFVFLPEYHYGSVRGEGILYLGGMCHNLDHPAAQDFVFYYSILGSIWALSPLAAHLVSGADYAWTAGSIGQGASLAANAVISSAAATWRSNAIPAPFVDHGGTSSTLHGEIYLTRSQAIIGKIPGLLVASRRMASDQGGALVAIDGSPHPWLYSAQNTHIVSAQGNVRGIGLLINTQEWVY